ncbi:MAG: sigma-70 family RNA polymerase sigma factor [Isosphaerales bacterium]
MSAHVTQSFDILLKQARAGDADSLGCLLESYSAYLRLIARSLLRTASRGSVDVSDVVQETNLKACGDFPNFRGSDEPELVGWLRRILKNLVFNLLKKQGSPSQRTESLEALLERASQEAHWALATPGSTPSAQASRREQAVLTANALDSLKPEYKQVLILCYLEKAPHEEVGGLMGRSEKASRMLLMRAAKALEQRLREQS